MSRLSLRSRRRRRTEQKPLVWVARRSVIVVALLGAFIWFAASVYSGKPWQHYGTAFADLPNTGNLLKHDQVRIGGVRVGQILSTSVRPNGRARVELQLEPGTSLPSDTQVRVRANGLLGARYVELVPGSKDDTMKDGAVIRAAGTALSYGVPDALDTFDQETRGALGELVRGAGAGVAGRGEDVNTFIDEAAGVVIPGQQLFDEISSRPGAAKRLVPSANELAGAVEGSRPDLIALLRPGAQTLDAVVAKREALERSLDVAPSALQSATTGLDAGTPLLAEVRRLSASVDRTLAPAPGALRATTALLREAPRPLDRANTLLRVVPSAVPAALKATKALDPVLGPLQGTLRPAIPILDQVGPYGCDLTNFAVNVRSMTGFGGTGEGPAGPAMAFRLQATPTAPTETLGIGDTTGLVRRDGYPGPCAYPQKIYKTFNSLGAGG